MKRNLNASALCSFFIISLLFSCGSVQNAHKFELSDDHYLFRQNCNNYQRVEVLVKGDTFSITPTKKSEPVTINIHESLIFSKYTFDMDVMTIGFKYRPASVNLPRQMNTDFNGNLFLGVRADRFRIFYKKSPLGLSKKSFHRGITVGMFGGVGTTAVTPWTTNYKIADEYYGVTLSRGVAFMTAFNNLTVGLAVGWDTLTDRDKNVWIYQNKPWYGLALGLSVN